MSFKISQRMSCRICYRMSNGISFTIWSMSYKKYVLVTIAVERWIEKYKVSSLWLAPQQTYNPEYMIGYRIGYLIWCFIKYCIGYLNGYLIAYLTKCLVRYLEWYLTWYFIRYLKRYITRYVLGYLMRYFAEYVIVTLQDIAWLPYWISY